MSEHRDSQARIEILEPWKHGAKACNMCWYDAEPEDVKLISFTSPIGQGIITLALCQQHRQELRASLGDSHADLLAALTGLLTDQEVLVYLPDHSRTRRTCSGCGEAATMGVRIEHAEGCAVRAAEDAIEKARPDTQPRPTGELPVDVADLTQDAP